jgi:hypothetical protein
MQAYLVGGAVRDTLSGRVVKNRAWVVVGDTPDAMVGRGLKLASCSSLSPGLRRSVRLSNHS